ncbi:type IV secretion system protein VirB10 [Phenylobacterium sp.]|jgi:type IV secretion system protein VirB10|uniref:type IV secretion system protein VirB10 n=1 Tax=Phenylobacterium sp. TaxID=1871053 RepID=UPI002F41611B
MTFMNNRLEPDSAEPLSPVYARVDALRPQVQQPNSPWTVVVGLIGVLVIGVSVFTTLSHSREARAQPTPLKLADQPAPAWSQGLTTLLAQNTSQPPAPLAAQAPPPPAPIPAPAAPVVVAPDPSEANWKAPAVVVDLGDNSAAGAARAIGQTGVAGAPVAGGSGPQLNPDERFAARISGSNTETARAVQMRDLSRIVPQGFVVPATLETAIDSDLPGSVRAMVSRDVRGFDGKDVLIPRGSTIIGQYRSAAAIGQKRAFVVWSRIITPTGVSIDVGSPATDELGRGGLSGKADEHFFERFGSAILLSVISAGVDAAGRSNGNSTELVIGSATQANQVASIALQKQIDIPTTIRVPQGAPVQVSVARDLDFSGVAPYR